MKKAVKWVLSILLVLLVLAAGAGLYNQEKIVRLWNVNSLFDEDRIVANFSNMKTMFLSAPIKTGNKPFIWPTEPKSLPSTYELSGASKNLDDWIKQSRTTSLLVIQDGKLVSENYYLGTEQRDQRISWSMAKSFLSAVFGVAVSRGDIKSLDQPVTEYVDELRGTAYDGATIRNVFHMASGVKFNEDYLDYNSDINKMGRTLALGSSMDGFAASLQEKEGDTGEVRRYTSIDTHVLSMVLRKATGKSLVELVGSEIVSKLGFEHDAYYVTDGYGVAFALGGLNMSSRDYAKFGQMFLDHGQWQGEQIVPREWANQSVRDTAPASTKKKPFGYGYQWWVPQNASDEFFAVGIYGQYIFVDRPNRTVIVKTSAHREFRNDGVGGSKIMHETIEVFRSIIRKLATTY